MMAGDTSTDADALDLSNVFVDSVFTMKGRLVYLRVGALEATPLTDATSSDAESSDAESSDAESEAASFERADGMIGFTYAVGESRNESIMLTTDDLDALGATPDQTMINDAWIQNIYANDMSVVTSLCNSDSTDCRQLEVLIDVESGRYKVYPVEGLS